MPSLMLDHGQQFDLGVVVGRFQVPTLTEGHRHLIEMALARHHQVLVVIGHRPARRQCNHPLDYELRAAMITSAYPGVMVAVLNDVGDDDAWSIGLDTVISNHIDREPGAVLYGGRKSFIGTYTGRYSTCDIGDFASISGTEVRALVSSKPVHTSDFRAGVIYAVTNDFPVAYQAVDVAVLRMIDTVSHVLLGRRHSLATTWSLIGGISDPDDETLEATGVRELHEETHLTVNVDTLFYICSKKVRDWRYSDGPDDIKTALFASWEYMGIPTVTDEMVELQWFPVVSAANMARGTHRYLLTQLAKKVQ